MITKGVMKQHDFKDSVFYQVACECGNPECNMTLELEIDEDSPTFIFMSFHKKVAISAYWGNPNIFQRAWLRIKYALLILLKGHLEMEESHVFQDIEHIDNFIAAIQEGKEKLKNAGIPQDSDGVSA